MLTKKSKKLTLILFYSEFSMAFFKAHTVLKKAIEDLTPIGELVINTKIQIMINVVKYIFLFKFQVSILKQ